MERYIQEYLLERVIGEDIVGTVYQGLHIPSSQPVMLRKIPPSLQEGFDSQATSACNLLVSLVHPGIGKCYTYFRYQQDLYLIWEYSSGSALDQYLSCLTQPLSEEQVWDIALELIDAFVYAHRKGINHFTLHPGNILITPEGKVKIVDFGLVNLFLPHLKDLRELNQAGYRSPEQIQGNSLDERSDIYSFGVILFQLLTRQTPYPDVLSLAAIQEKILHHSFPPIKLYTTAFGHSYLMQAIVDKATAKNPAYRFEDFQALKESLLEEKEERETLLLDQLMQEVNQRSHLYAPEMISTITLAKQKQGRKRIGQTMLVLALMAGVIAIGINISSSPLDSELIVEEKENKTSANTESKVSASDNQVSKQDTITKATDPVARETTISPPKQEVVEKQESPAVAAKGEQKTRERTISQAGFSLETQPENHSMKMQLENHLEKFYSALRTKDLSQMNGYYATSLIRFFNERNVNEKQLQTLLQKAWSRTPQDTHEILWDTFHYSQDEQGNYNMEFYMNYTYHRANRKNWRSRKIYTLIKMDKDLKIYYMAGD